MIEISLAVVHLSVVVLILVACARTKIVQVAPSEVPATPADEAATERIESSDSELADNEMDENSGNFIKCVGSERPSGTFRGTNVSPTNRYATIVQIEEGKNVIFPMFVVDVCRSTYSLYTADESDEYIQQLRNSNFYWLADDMIVVIQYKDDQLIRYIYELDHKKKTVTFVYKGEHSCKFPVQVTGDGNINELYNIEIENRRYTLIVGTDFHYFQVFHRDPRVPPKYSHAFYLDLEEIRQHLLLAHEHNSLLNDRYCHGSKMRFEILKRCDGLHEDGSAIWAPAQMLTFDMKRIFEKQPDALTDIVTIGAGDEDCWSIAKLQLAEPDIILRKPCNFSTFLTHGLHTCGKAIFEKSGTHFYFEIEMVLIDLNTKKCIRDTYCTKRQKLTPGVEQMATVATQLHPVPRFEQWIWDEARGGPCWSIIKSFPPAVVPSLQDMCRDVIMKNREKYSEDLPDYAGIMFPE